MPYSAGKFPSSWKNVPEKVRSKAVSILNALLEEGELEEGIAIATALKNARTWAAKHVVEDAEVAEYLEQVYEEEFEEGIKAFMGVVPEEVKKPARRMFDEVFAETEARNTMNTVTWAFNDSVASIVGDRNISQQERERLVAESLQQFIAAVKERLPKLTAYAEVEDAVAEYVEQADYADKDIELADGVWRTVNGRRIFIKKGQDAKEALEKSLSGDKAQSKEEHRAAMSYHANMAKRAAQAGDKKTAQRHEAALEAHMDAFEKGGKEKDARSSSRARMKSDDAHYGKGKIEKYTEYEEDTEVANFANTIQGVEVFKPGTHNGDTYTEKDLDDMVTAFGKLDFRPAIKLGHSKEPGDPAYGYVENLRKVKDRLVADFTDVHDKVFEAIRNKQYDRVSAEVYFNLKRAGDTFRRALKAVALLGSEVPAVAGLKPISEVKFTDDTEWDAVGAYEQALEVPAEALLACMADRLADLINQTKEMDMAKNAEKIATLQARVAELKAGMDEMMKKKMKKHPDEMGDDEEYTKLKKQADAISKDIKTLEDEDKAHDASVDAMRVELAQAKQREEQLATRLATLEQRDRMERIGQRVAECKVPAFRPGLQALYAYAQDHPAETVKVYSKKDGKDVGEDKSLGDIVDGFVTYINGQAEKLFKALTFSGAKRSGMESVEDLDLDKTFEDPQAEVGRKVTEYQAAHPEVKSYQVALKTVLSTNAELATRYREQLEGAGQTQQ